MIQCDRTIKNVCKSIRDGAGFLHETAQERLLRVKFKLDLKKKKKMSKRLLGGFQFAERHLLPAENITSDKPQRN